MGRKLLRKVGLIILLVRKADGKGFIDFRQRSHIAGIDAGGQETADLDVGILCAATLSVMASAMACSTRPGSGHRPG